MAIVEMKKLTLIGLKSEREAILKSLQQLGNVEIQNITDLEDSNENSNKADDTYKGIGKKSGTAENANELSNINGLEYPYTLDQKLSEVKFALQFLKSYNTEKKGMLSGKQAVSISKLSEVMDKQSELISITKQCRKLDEGLTNLRTRQTRLVNTIGQLMPWKDLRLTFDSVSDTSLTRVQAGIINKDNIDPLIQSIADEYDEVSINTITIEKENAYCLVLYHRSLDDTIPGVLKEYGFDRITFSGFDKSKTAEEIINECENEIADITKEERAIADRASELLSNVDELEILHDGLYIELDKFNASNKVLNTGKAFMLKGWLPKYEQKKLEARLSKITNALVLEFEDPAENEVFPVALENTQLIQPFEAVTSLYSTPYSKGLDPNLYMAPFFFTFFGMMLGDAGYGLILAIVGALFVKKLKPKGMMKKLGWLISLGGVSTFIWGALYGSWFGNLGNIVAEKLGFESAVLWFDPMKDPIFMLGICFGFGLIHVFSGMILQIYIDAKRGNLLWGLIDQGLWIVLVIGLILLATPVSQLGKVLSIIGAGGLVLTQGRKKKNIIQKLLSGVVSLYNITGILSDVLSYSRLFALGLATGVIGMVINMLGAMTGTSLLGIISTALIFVGGHLFNILINVLGAFVHSSRLQYIEFFGKFFEGGGHAFAPLSIKTKYIDLINEEAV